MTIEGTLHFELDLTVNECEEGVILTHANVVTSVELRAALTNNDATSVNSCVTENLYTKALSLGVTTVAGRAATFLMCHFLASL